MTREMILSEAQAIAKAIQAHRRWLHAHGEVGFALTETKAYVTEELEKLGCDVRECGKAGLVTTLGNGKKTILLRADMDALPIEEETDLDFACPHGRMHACGHDLHTAMLLGAATLLKAHEAELPGTVKLMFQPAEEILEGAKDMIGQGLLENPKVDAALMIHVAAPLPFPAGTVIISAPGVTAPGADYFKIHVQGRGCHGSTPQDGVDALTAAAQILIALQEIHARELSSADEAVLTIGTFQGGTAANVIADSAVLGGTIRTYDENVRVYLKERIGQIAAGIASAFRATASVEFGSGCPPLTNDADLCSDIAGYLKELLGSQGALTAADLASGGKPSRSGGSEDFAYVSQKVPALMLALAAGEPAKGYTAPLHHPKVRFDERILPIGSAVFAYAAIRYLENS